MAEAPGKAPAPDAEQGEQLDYVNEGYEGSLDAQLARQAARRREEGLAQIDHSLEEEEPMLEGPSAEALQNLGFSNIELSSSEDGTEVFRAEMDGRKFEIKVKTGENGVDAKITCFDPIVVVDGYATGTQDPAEVLVGLVEKFNNQVG